MNPQYDEVYYRSLLEAAHKGIESCKSFLEAVSISEAALKDATLRQTLNTTKKRLEDFEDEADQLWDLFKRALTHG